MINPDLMKHIGLSSAFIHKLLAMLDLLTSGGDPEEFRALSAQAKVAHDELTAFTTLALEQHEILSRLNKNDTYLDRRFEGEIQ